MAKSTLPRAACGAASCAFRLGLAGAAGAILLAASPAAFAGDSLLYSFTGTKAGSGQPRSSLIVNQKGTLLYGTTFGVYNRVKAKNPGTVFALAHTKKGWVETVLYQFKGGSDGEFPAAALVEGAGGVLYGTTQAGGANKQGTVFSLTPPPKGSKGWTETVLFSFKAPGIFSPSGSLTIGAGGVLFGTAGTSRSSAGGVFELTPPAQGQTSWTEQDIYDFAGGADGAIPTAGLLMNASGALFGTTLDGGNSCSENTSGGCGTVFELTPPASGQSAWSKTTLYAFSGSDGSGPYSTLVSDSNGVLYGTTDFGGTANAPGYGVIFSLTPPSKGNTNWSETTLYSCAGYPDCDFLEAGVVFGPGGALYGTSAGGGTDAEGTVFKLAPPAPGSSAWTESLVYSFQWGLTDGQGPTASVVFDSAGNLYGTTAGGGAYKYGGTVFELTP